MRKASVLTGMARGFIGRCPNCAKGRLFRRYLKVESPCRACGHDNAQYPSDDAPPYFTILIVGHLVVAPLLLFPIIWEWPAERVLAIFLPAVLILTLGLLPRVKGAVIGVQWALRRAGGDTSDAVDEPAWNPASEPRG